jgi:hypothetical protein
VFRAPKAGWVPSMPMPAALWPNTLLHRHSVFCETDQEAVNKAKLYVDGHGVELWEGTRQVALLTRSNLPLNSGGFFAAASAPPSGRLCLGTINGRGGYVHVPGPRRHLCV